MPSTVSSSRRKSNKRKRESTPPIIDVPHFPYFAHQQLDPAVFAGAINLPVGRPEWAPAPNEIASVTNGGWSDIKDEPLDHDPGEYSGYDDDEYASARIKHEDEENKIVGRNTYKHLRTNGGRPALAKKVTADLDSDDELIVRMKEAKYLEKDIATRL
ncbi:hypothetical protein LTR66_016814, partial [Elasticomyces elasticus]